MDSLRRSNMPVILKATSGVCDLLSNCGVPAAGIVKAGTDLLSGYVDPDCCSGALSGGRQLGQNQLTCKVGDKVGFEQLNASFAQVFGELEVGWSTKFLCREILRNIYFVFCEIIFFISRNFVSRNILKYRENFETKLKISQGKIHF
jgi:hypothetical protein